MYISTPPQTQMFPQPCNKGIVERAIAPDKPGRVKAMGSYWPAELYQPDSQACLLPGQEVLVVGINNITLLVVPL